jgi:RNA recognition motif-containing protein
MNKKLYVGNLLYEITDEELRELFSQAGDVDSASVIRFHDSGRSKGFAFVEMNAEEGAQKAIEMFHDQDYKGRKLLVSEARPPKPRTSFGGGDRPQRNGGSRGDFQNQDE